MARTLHSTAHPPSFMNLCAICFERYSHSDTLARKRKGYCPDGKTDALLSAECYSHSDTVASKGKGVLPEWQNRCVIKR